MGGILKGDQGACEPVQVGPDGVPRGKITTFRFLKTLSMVSKQTAPYTCAYVLTWRSQKYPVVPSFAYWRFLHDNLSHGLPASLLLTGSYLSLTEATLARDISCRITNHIDGREHAHVVLRSEERWFSENGMF